MKKFIAIIVLMVLVVSIGVGFRFAYSSSVSHLAQTPIQHIVIIMQENQAFDHFFGAFPGIQSPFALQPTWCVNSGVCPYNGDSQASTIQGKDLPHSWNPSHRAYNNGLMNGFVSAEKSKYTMSYYTGATLPDYWDYVQYYTLNANFFSSELSYSYPNHLWMVAAEAPGCFSSCNPTFNLNYETIGTELTNANVSWGYFVDGWSDSNQCHTITSSTSNVGHLYWNVIVDFPAIQLNLATCHNVQSLQDLKNRIVSNTLPSVSWVIPTKSESDHSPASLKTGQEYVSNIVNLISESKAWSSTCIFLTWDDYGGYADHIVPVQLDGQGSSFRVGLITISPYSKHGTIVYGLNGNQQEDFSAFETTIEQNWNLAPLAQRDANEYSLFYMLNFSQVPMSPLILPNGTLATYP